MLSHLHDLVLLFQNEPLLTVMPSSLVRGDNYRGERSVPLCHKLHVESDVPTSEKRWIICPGLNFDTSNRFVVVHRENIGSPIRRNSFWGKSQSLIVSMIEMHARHIGVFCKGNCKA